MARRRSRARGLEAVGIPVLVIEYSAEMPARHVASTRAIGAVTGKEARAETLVVADAGSDGHPVVPPLRAIRP